MCKGCTWSNAEDFTSLSFACSVRANIMGMHLVQKHQSFDVWCSRECSAISATWEKVEKLRCSLLHRYQMLSCISSQARIYPLGKLILLLLVCFSQFTFSWPHLNTETVQSLPYLKWAKRPTLKKTFSVWSSSYYSTNPWMLEQSFGNILERVCWQADNFYTVHFLGSTTHRVR